MQQAANAASITNAMNKMMDPMVFSFFIPCDQKSIVSMFPSPVGEWRVSLTGRISTTHPQVGVVADTGPFGLAGCFEGLIPAGISSGVSTRAVPCSSHSSVAATIPGLCSRFSRWSELRGMKTYKVRSCDALDTRLDWISAGPFEDKITELTEAKVRAAFWRK